ncbi:MAG: GFA family protein [Hyphomonadaceae bacterium]
MTASQHHEGGCRCGAVRYTLNVAQLPRTYACHCLDCQTWSGSAVAEAMIVPEAALAVTGDVTIYELTGASGHVSRQRMCPVCHARVFNTNTACTGLVVIRGGTLDNSHTLDVVARIWTKRRQPWLVIAEGAPAWPEMAPTADFMKALGLG